MAPLGLQLTPFFSGDGAPKYIDIKMSFNLFEKRQDEVLFYHTMVRGPVQTMQYNSEDIKVTDSEGNIAMRTIDSKGGRERVFRLLRNHGSGEMRVTYRALPRDVDEFAQCGPQVALETDGRGFSAAGIAILLRLASEEFFDITISWDLSRTPTDTRAVCSFGEGTEVHAHEKPSVLDECFFAVGQLHSYPPSTTNLPQGLYWLSPPNFDPTALGRRLETLLPKMLAFFHDPDPTFRIFMRQNAYKCASGRGLHRGFVFAWNHIVPRAADEVTLFLFHELVHNWPRLGFTTGGPEDLADGWFNEGIAEFYSLVLPLRFGVFAEEEFVVKLNVYISGYYTNPDRGVWNRDVQQQFWKGGHVNRVPYQRGLMYFLQLAYQLHQAAKAPLDKLIMNMLELRRRDEPHGIKIWLAMVTEELGQNAVDEYERMSRAELMVLPENVLDAILPDNQWSLRRQDQEGFYLGFSEDCLTKNPRVVEDLDLESRAAKAGVREGDVVLNDYSYFYVADQWDQEFRMTVKRKSEDGGREELKEMRWWPRSWTTVESYQFENRR